MDTTENFKNIKSTKKLAKKANQMYRREIRAFAKDKVDAIYKTFEEHLRPKPRWIPKRVWRIVQNIVLIHYNHE